MAVRSGVPPLPGVVGFALLAGLCLAVVWLLYRSPTVGAPLTRHPARLVRDGAPLVVAVALVFYGVWRAGRVECGREAGSAEPGPGDRRCRAWPDSGRH
ncbi:hypothetical protein [Micromonospora sp. LOL_015]|uniref:hypothetical protein n=1 Tax=Micromonospora sp. LOL_015 TaxID=3345416 RepID=UPI003A87B736